MLLFKKQFLDAIRRGEKTQTIRIAKVMRFKAGQRSYIPGAGYILIDVVEQVTLAQLTDADARLDGFATIAELRAALEEIYPDGLADDVRAWRIAFRLLPPDDQIRLKEKWKRPAQPKTDRK